MKILQFKHSLNDNPPLAIEMQDDDLDVEKHLWANHKNYLEAILIKDGIEIAWFAKDIEKVWRCFFVRHPDFNFNVG